MDNVAPTGTTAIQATDTAAGGKAGQAEAGDTISYTFSEAIEPDSISAGWNGATTVNVTLALNNGATDDTVTVPNLGTVTLVGNYTNANVNFTNSQMTMAGNTITIVLGTASGGVKKETTAAAMVWTPSTAPIDLAGNPVSTAPFTEAIPLDVEF